MASQTISILCSHCGTFIARYQKKGTGQLIRLYLDRVSEPTSLSQLKTASSKIKLPPLDCSDCGNRIGLPMTHDKGRWAYRMIKGAFRRKRDN